MNNEVTYEQLRTDLQKIVDESPNKKAYCTYVQVNRQEDGADTVTPECIVGQWLVKTRRIPAHALIDGNGSLCGRVVVKQGIRLNNKAQVYLSIVQAAQDEQISWKDALDIADGAMRRIESFA